MSLCVKVLHDLMYTGEIIDPQVAHVFSDGRKIEKCNCDSSSGELMDELDADFRGHDRDPADLVLHHALSGFPSPAGVVVGIAEDHVVAELPRPGFKTLPYLGKKRVLETVAVETPVAFATSRIVTVMFGGTRPAKDASLCRGAESRTVSRDSAECK